MKLLEEKEMINCYGGGKLTASIAAIVTGIIVFVMGVVDGLSNPKACNVGR